MLNEKKIVTYENIQYLTGLAFIEIRAASNLRTAQALADIFHNVPSQIQNGKEPQVIMEDILARADRLGIKSRLEKWRDNAINRDAFKTAAKSV